ncbi:hypothetical protein LTR36_010719 [Oleoguttula mirabilis]|uniref:Uncharacterized protein n=1 Tax=Oleoguttula mirabilis TaxID=1507867 RepID=A0AAV9JQX1_9PEZI|nr:hypothetical protein LTR36_010719 [Oleoguttula mirabilis]
MSASMQRTTHLDLLKSQIDAGATDFSVFLRELGRPPSDDAYRAGARYAHMRLRERLEYVNWMYDRIDRARQQTLLNTARAEQKLVSVEELAAVKLERISSESLNVRTDVESWVRDAKKGGLQMEIRAVIVARRRVEAERDRLFRLWEDATRAEKANRPAEEAHVREDESEQQEETEAEADANGPMRRRWSGGSSFT